MGFILHTVKTHAARTTRSPMSAQTIVQLPVRIHAIHCWLVNLHF